MLGCQTESLAFLKLRASSVLFQVCFVADGNAVLLLETAGADDDEWIGTLINTITEY